MTTSWPLRARTIDPHFSRACAGLSFNHYLHAFLDAGGDAEAAIFWPHYRELQLLKRHGHVDDVAHAVVFLASDESAFVTGQILNVDGAAVAHL